MSPRGACGCQQISVLLQKKIPSVSLVKSPSNTVYPTHVLEAFPAQPDELCFDWKKKIYQEGKILEEKEI